MAFYDWIFALGFLAGSDGDCTLAILHRHCSERIRAALNLNFKFINIEEMNINFYWLGFFVLGMVTQAFYMLRSRWEKGDIKRILISMAVGLFGLLPFRNEDGYNLGLHLFGMCLVAAFAFAKTFQKRIISAVGARSLIILNILVVFLIVNRWGFSQYIFAIILIPTLATLINGFTDLGKYFFWQVFFYTWFAIMLVFIGLLNFGFNEFIKIFSFDVENSGIFYLNTFILGSAFLYIVTNIWFVIGLIPYKRKDQTYGERIQEIKKHMQLLAYGYIWEKENRGINFLLLVSLLVLMVLNFYYRKVDDKLVITAALALMPILGRIRSAENEWRDGMGDAIYSSGDSCRVDLGN